MNSIRVPEENRGMPSFTSIWIILIRFDNNNNLLNKVKRFTHNLKLSESIFNYASEKYLNVIHRR